MAVEPTRSQKSTVTCFRSPAIAACVARILWARPLGMWRESRVKASVAGGGAVSWTASFCCRPQSGQKRKSGSIVAPQPRHCTATCVPHAWQNHFAADAVYHNMPVAPVTGHDGIRELLNMFAPAAETAEFEILAIASRGSLVFTERIDRFAMNGRQVALPVAGVFDIRDGKIAAWRDYFDFATWQRQVA